MTLQQLRYFIVTAELFSFTRAAEMCVVSQPALSHAIHELEQELGCPLFVREGKKIRLTAKGEKLLAKAKQIEQAAAEMKEIAGRDEERQTIKIGYVVLGHLNAYLDYQAECVPGEFLTKYQISTGYDEITTIRQHLMARQYDFIIVPAGNISGLQDCERVQITPDSLSLIIRSDDPLTEKQKVFVTDLSDRGFIFYPNNSELNEAYKKLCMKNGFEPKIVGYGKKMGDIVAEVIQKNAVAFCSSTFRYLENSTIRIVELQGDISPFHLELVKLKSNLNPAAAEIFQMFKNKNNL